jgi:hypothetical protein
LSYERSLIVVVLNLRKNGIESEGCATAAAAADVLVRREAGSDLEGLKSVFCSLHELSSSPAAPSLLQSKIQSRDLMFSGAKKRSWFVAERRALHPPLPLGWQQKHGDDDDFNMAIIFGTGFQAEDCEADVSFFLLLLLLLLHLPNLLNRKTDLLLLADFLPIALLCVVPSFCGTREASPKSVRPL